MPLQVGLWRMVDNGKPQRVTAGSMPTERQLEELIEHDPAILGDPLLIIGLRSPLITVLMLIFSLSMVTV